MVPQWFKPIAQILKAHSKRFHTEWENLNNLISDISIHILIEKRRFFNATVIPDAEQNKSRASLYALHSSIVPTPIKITSSTNSKRNIIHELQSCIFNIRVIDYGISNKGNNIIINLYFLLN